MNNIRRPSDEKGANSDGAKAETQGEKNKMEGRPANLMLGFDWETTKPWKILCALMLLIILQSDDVGHALAAASGEQCDPGKGEVATSVLRRIIGLP